MQTRHVVTCFLETDHRILILKRSDQVGTYRGKWAAVSGYVETTPDEQCTLEIREETGLKEEDISLIAKGDPLPVKDEKLQVQWIVYPYLFKVKKPEKVTIDWEHREFKWISPGEMSRYETVPMLKEALERVLID